MKIDMVYLWCDGNDPEFIKRKNEFMDDGEKIVKINGDVRFWDNEELRYSLRSLEKYASWINHVYIITDRQIPYWLDTTYEKVTVVDHSEIMPAECIPCFNSNVIEYFLPFVPNLSEKFLYGNDDTFFGDFVKPEDFFEGDKPIARMTTYGSSINNLKSCVRNLLGSKNKKSITPMGNAICLLQKEYGNFGMLSTHHNIDAYSKDAYLETLNKFSDSFSETNKYRFRNKNCIHRLIFALDAILAGKAVYKIVPTFSGLSKIFVGLKKEQVFSYFGKEYHIDRLRKVIKQNKPKLFCLNASEKTTKEIKLEAKRFMEEMFPNPSKFEK